jgi:hypothetical protein
MTVDADEAGVLHQHFQAARPLCWMRITWPGAAARTGAPAGAGRSTPL